ncbi:hypothetical protein HYDPIDRAFT_85399 [Hydnomerulius pinastri MD-312]|nr:hypothetical protein HYDPIDRAFT_85399 [Hydnomerulius pinastri MD-312]
MEKRLSQVPPIDTVKLPDAILRFLAKSSKDSFQRDHLKPTEVTRAFATSYDHSKGQVRAQADRFQNKIRKSNNQVTRMHVSGSAGVGSFTVSAQVTSAMGGSALLEGDGNLADRHVATITLTGRADPTAAEVKRARIILLILQGRIISEGNSFTPWTHKIFLSPGDDFMWPAEWSQSATRKIRFNPDKNPRPLNDSQQKAIKCMLDQSDAFRATIIQGPPGTGKTTVIASYVHTATACGQTGIWLIAQSNVAVKNIAEKLADFGLTNWKLLVSNNFFEFWHEHLYTMIRLNTIIINEEFQTRQLHNCPVVLCTLSMLSSSTLQRRGVFDAAPIRTVVIDEASQIEIGDYIPLFSSFPTIRKVTFIGDNMQLPPHGQEDIKELQSIFEVDHLTKGDQVIFLDTQYRMPPQIGDFISQTVYSSKLQSNDYHPLANSEALLCHFVNVPGAQVQQGTSWKNLEECKAILKLASIFQAQEKNFRIITPYDAQRTIIEDGLKEAELEWGDKCFNVDSFQGNYSIILDF